MADRTVIVGAGHAGATLAASLRDEGYDGAIVLLSAETELPYHRPPLSKSFMTGPDEAAQHLRPERFYQENGIELRLGQAVEEIDLRACRVVARSGDQTSFTRLAIATGGRPRRMAGEGAGLSGIEFLRTIEDARRIKRSLPGLERLVVIGGGFIGLELAASLSERGIAVTVLETTDRLMGRAAATETSRHFLELHRGWGVEVLLGEGLGRFLGESGRLSAIETTAGRRIATSMAVVGIGIAPDVRLCRAAGLPCDDGVIVDECLMAGDGVVAIGDCAAFRRHSGGPLLRIESVQNATDQARVAARSLLGRRDPYRAVPWFWSDQRRTKLQIAGLSAGADASVVRGDPAGGRFSVFRYRGDRLVAVDSVDRPGEHLLARKLIAAGMSPSREQAGDPEFDLKTLLVTGSEPRPGRAMPSPPVLEALGAPGYGNGEPRAR